MSTSILVVEDEPDIRELLTITLKRSSYEVMSAESGDMAIDILQNNIPDLAIIDWMMPGMSGIEVARYIRQECALQHLPIIMLTARSAEADKLQSFESGVDDYVTKPFSPKELQARVKALLRRSGAINDEQIRISNIRIDTAEHRVFVDNLEIQIGATEFRLLEFLARNPNRAYSREQLLDRVWGRNVYLEERTVDVHILRLRKILQPHDLSRLIETVRGVGYRFAAKV